MIASIEYEAEKKLDLPYKEVINDTALTSSDYEECLYEVEVGAILMDNGTIQEINRERRCTDASMDILSFPMMDYEVPSDLDRVEDAAEDHFSPETGELILGGIVIFADRVKGQADKHGHPQTHEPAFLVAHSMLHLRGYDHVENGEREQMEERQRKILETRGYTR